MKGCLCYFISWENIKEIRKRKKMKKKFKIERNYTDKKIRIVCFVNEVIKNWVSCRWFYEIVKGIKDFVQLIQQKKNWKKKFTKKLDSIKNCNNI